jgi:phenylpyruvate tautomerase PptA (4-oxalocrotonate tautomerase family)
LRLQTTVPQRRKHATRSNRFSGRQNAGVREYGIQIGQIVYKALVDVLSAPKDDLFQVITEHSKAGLQFDRDYLGVERSDDCIFLQITLNSGRSVELKQRFYKAVAGGLHEQLKLRQEDVFVNLVEVAKENWSYGNGEAQYISPTR